MTAILLALGALGWLGFRLNMFLNVMTPLIMVISFSDSMQLTFAARDRLLEGEGKYEALRNSMLVVGPACVLTHATAALSFVALQFSDSDLIRSFGEAGFIATLIALIAILLLTPLLGVLVLRDDAAFVARIKRHDFGVEALRRFCAFIAVHMVSRPGLYSFLGLVVVVGLGLNYANLQPRYRLADQVPDRQRAVAASERLDVKLTGANPIDVLIEFPPGVSLYTPETLNVIASVHAIVEKQQGVGTLVARDIAPLARREGAQKRRRRSQAICRHAAGAFAGAVYFPEGDAVVVSGRVPDLDASRLLPIVDNLDKALAGVRAAHPGYAMAVTGLSAIAARNSANMIAKLNRGLTVEFAGVAFFLGLAFLFRRRDVFGDPAGDLSDCRLWRLAPHNRSRPPVRERRGAHRVVRIGPQRDDPFPQSRAARG